MRQPPSPFLIFSSFLCLFPAVQMQPLLVQPGADPSLLLIF